jgi:hypothetical protein
MLYMYDLLSSIEVVSKVKKTTEERADAMVQAARELGHITVTRLDPEDETDVVRVSILGLIDSEHRLGPLFDKTNDIYREQQAVAEAN